MLDLGGLMPWIAAVMIAVDLAWLAAIWWLGGSRLRAAAVVAAALTIAWALAACGLVPLDGLRTPAIDLTGVIWHAAIAPIAVLIIAIMTLARCIIMRSHTT
jgi:hypothetical protein